MADLRWVVLCLLLGEAVASASSVTLATGDVTTHLENELPATEGVTVGEWVELRNTSAAERHVTAQLSGIFGKIRRSVVLAPGEHRFVTLPVPPNMLPGQLEVTVQETDAQDRSLVRGGSAEKAPYLVVGSDTQLAQLTTVISPRQTFSLSAPQLPDLMAGYGAVKGVLLLDPAVNALSSEQKRALEDYVRLGGVVYFGPELATGPIALDEWRSTEATAASVGWGTIRLCRKSGSCDLELEADDFRTHRFWDELDLIQAARTPAETYGPDQPVFPSSYTMLKEVGRPPVTAFLVIALLFAAAMGPGTLLFARRYGRHTLLLTIPVLALTTCTGIGGYSLASDGLFVTHAATRSITLLDGDAHRAATISVTGYYASLEPGTLRYAANTMDSLETRVLHGTIDWSEGLTLTGPFIPSREYRERALATIQTSRARLALHGESVDNELGGPIRSGYVRMNGQIWRLPAVARGASGQLVSVIPDGGDDSNNKQNKSEPPELPLLKILTDHAQRFSVPATEPFHAPLQEGEFVAELSDSDLVPTGGLTLTQHESVHLVRGKVSR